MIVSGTPLHEMEAEFPSDVKIGQVAISVSRAELFALSEWFQSLCREVEDGNTSDHYHFQRKVDVYPDIVVLMEEFFQAPWIDNDGI